MVNQFNSDVSRRYSYGLGCSRQGKWVFISHYGSRFVGSSSTNSAEGIRDQFCLARLQSSSTWTRRLFSRTHADFKHSAMLQGSHRCVKAPSYLPYFEHYKHTHHHYSYYNNGNYRRYIYYYYSAATAAAFNSIIVQLLCPPFLLPLYLIILLLLLLMLLLLPQTQESGLYSGAFHTRLMLPQRATLDPLENVSLELELVNGHQVSMCVDFGNSPTAENCQLVAPGGNPWSFRTHTHWPLTTAPSPIKYNTVKMNNSKMLTWISDTCVIF